MDFSKLTVRSQEAVAAAQEHARRSGNPELYPEHLLLALLEQELPQQLVHDAAALHAETEAKLRAKPAIQGSSQQPAAGEADGAVERSQELPAELWGGAERPEGLGIRPRRLAGALHLPHRQDVVEVTERDVDVS